MSDARSPSGPHSPSQLLGTLNDVERKNSPEVLYAAGELKLLKRGPRVSIVGSRKASRGGLNRAERLARDLAKERVIVVSGLAQGIDTAAHKAAMDAGGRTIAVLGNPLDTFFPAENRALQVENMRDHLAISQFRPGTPIQRTNFPQRNRTMALISDATVIVEAGRKSGSISQGWEALRLGRRLFIMRNVADDHELLWPAEMIRYGAEVLAETEEILDALPLGAGDSVAAAF